jgi:hypothetical protein
MYVYMHVCCCREGPEADAVAQVAAGKARIHALQLDEDANR